MPLSDKYLPTYLYLSLKVYGLQVNSKTHILQCHSQTNTYRVILRRLPSILNHILHHFATYNSIFLILHLAILCHFVAIFKFAKDILTLPLRI